MKKSYIKPQLEIFRNQPEKGYATSTAMGVTKDYVLIEGNDGSTLRTSEEVTEFTDDQGEFTIGQWGE